jgi:hypothetical protein
MDRRSVGPPGVRVLHGRDMEAVTSSRWCGERLREARACASTCSRTRTSSYTASTRCVFARGPENAPHHRCRSHARPPQRATADSRCGGGALNMRDTCCSCHAGDSRPSHVVGSFVAGRARVRGVAPRRLPRAIRHLFNNADGAPPARPCRRCGSSRRLAQVCLMAGMEV